MNVLYYYVGFSLHILMTFKKYYRLTNRRNGRVDCSVGVRKLCRKNIKKSRFLYWLYTKYIAIYTVKFTITVTLGYVQNSREFLILTLGYLFNN